MIKTINLYDKNIVNNSISFNRLIKFITSDYDMDYIQKKISSNDFNDLCKKILSLTQNINSYLKKKSITQIKTKTNISLKQLLGYNIFSFKIIYFLKYIISDITNINHNNKYNNPPLILLISNYFEFTKLFDQLNYNYDLCIYNSFDKKNIKLETKLKTHKLSYQYYDNVSKMFLELTNTNMIKYDNIIIKNHEKNCDLYIIHFQLLQFPNFITSLTISLLKLKKNGNLYYMIRICEFNEALHKIIKLLFNSFKKVELIKSQDIDSSCMIKCEGFLDNIKPTKIDQLVKISILSRKYFYDFCQYFNYIYYIQKNNPKNNKLFYKLDLNQIGHHFKPSQTSIKIIDDIDLDLDLDSNKNFNNNTELSFFIYNIKKTFSTYLENLHFNILKYSTEDDKGNINITPEYINNINYKNILYAISFLEENNIPYNKSYITYINRYNKNIINQLYSYEYAIKHKIVKYKTLGQSLKKTNKSFKYNQKQKSYKKQSHKHSPQQIQIKIQKEPYHYDNFNKMNDLNTMAYKVKLNLLEQFSIDSVPRNIKMVTEDFARGVASYLIQNFKLHYKISNAFCKLWEIFHTVNNLLPLNKPSKVFFVAEAPGQWIYASNLYFQKHNKQKQTNTLEWRANTLNPQNPANIQKYGKDIFDDQYGFMKKYPNQWIYGVDDTGDITNSANQRWYRQYAKEFGPIDLVTGDGGILSDNPLIFQKLDYAQMCMVASLSSRGGNCVIKHFLPYVRRAPISYYGYGLFINYLYLYNLMFDEFNLVKPLTSNPDSGEFYVVCKGFRGVSEEMYEKMLNVLDNFTVNICFFDRKDIPDEFVNQIMDFVDKLLNMNVEHSEITNLLLTCMIHKNPVIEEATHCSKYLDKKYIEKIHNEKFKEWVKNNEFE